MLCEPGDVGGDEGGVYEVVESACCVSQVMWVVFMRWWSLRAV